MGAGSFFTLSEINDVFLCISFWNNGVSDPPLVPLFPRRSCSNEIDLNDCLQEAINSAEAAKGEPFGAGFLSKWEKAVITPVIIVFSRRVAVAFNLSPFIFFVFFSSPNFYEFPFIWEN